MNHFQTSNWYRINDTSQICLIPYKSVVFHSTYFLFFFVKEPVQHYVQITQICIWHFENSLVKLQS